jgi:hypothetical protein
LLPLLFFAAASLTVPAFARAESDCIRPYEQNPFYWQYKGKPVLLLGGSWQDNLFNHPIGLAAHLDLLVSVGGNYVRNTMSHRNVGNLFAFAQDEEGRFDLNRFNPEYWDRFENFLKLTHERDVIVQIEIWDPHDFYRDREAYGGWSHQPFNPLRNINYTPDDSGLPTEIAYGVTPSPSAHAFYRTVPALDNNERVLAYQRAFVDRLLDHSLKYPHVLYTMNNEIGELNAWGDYWAGRVRQRAEEVGVTVYTADMRRNHNIRTDDHRHLYDRPELYTFLDISQVTGSKGQSHYDDIVFVREYIEQRPRPINNVKNYGAAKHGGEESVARFCRMIFAGGASSRFHRPYPLETPNDHEGATQWGLGLCPRAQTIIRAMREFEGAFDLFRAAPRNDLLSDREADEAYLLALPGEQYALYFPAGGSVTLDLSDASGEMVLRRLDVDSAEWRQEGAASGGDKISIAAPAARVAAEERRVNLIGRGSFEGPPANPPHGYTGCVNGWALSNHAGHILNAAGGPFYTSALGPIPDGTQVYACQGGGVLSQKLYRLGNGQPFSFSCQVNCREGNAGMDLQISLGRQILWSGTVVTNHGRFHEISVEGTYDSSWGDTLTFEFTHPLGDSTLLLDDAQLWTSPIFGKHCIVVISPKKP